MNRDEMLKMARCCAGGGSCIDCPGRNYEACVEVFAKAVIEMNGQMNPRTMTQAEREEFWKIAE